MNAEATSTGDDQRDGDTDGSARRRALTAAAGVARAFSRTAAGATLDVASGGLRAVEAAGEALSGKKSGPGVLRVEMVILSDKAGPLTSPAAVAPALERATKIFREQANVRIRIADVQVVATPAPALALDPRANRALLLDDVLGRVRFYRDHVKGAVLAAVGTPVTVVVVRNIAGQTTGCSLGTASDWVIAQASLFDDRNPLTYDETVLAHELGHALNLPHHRDKGNLMFPESSPPDGLRGEKLNRWQAAVIGGNRRVIPGVAR